MSELSSPPITLAVLDLHWLTKAGISHCNDVFKCFSSLLAHPVQGMPYVRGRYCNLRFSELDRDMKVSFKYDVPILVDYTYAKNEPSEHMESRAMSIGANCVKIRICRKNCRLLAVFNIALL
jgi:hypothetical protein